MRADPKVLNDEFLVPLKSRSIRNLGRRDFDLLVDDQIGGFVPLVGTRTLAATALRLFLLCRFQLARLYRWFRIAAFETCDLILELLDDLALLSDDLQQQNDELALLFLRDLRYVNCQSHRTCA